MILLAIAAVAAGYQLIAIVACVLRPRRPFPIVHSTPPVSILKPVDGLDPGFRDALASHVALVGEFEILCGVSNLNDPAVAVMRKFPSVGVIECRTKTPNGKVGILMDLVAAARYPILVINDADIRVEPDYLARVTAPLADPQVGLVTCLYRASGDTLAARFEGLGISTDFAPSTLVARLAGVDEFAFGSTLALRRTDLERAGGFAPISNYLADDYRLGNRLNALGLKCVFSDVIVETRVCSTWNNGWKHQLRWARTIRVSNYFGYLGLPVTYATVWAVVAAALGREKIALILLAARMLMALTSGWFMMRSRDVLRLWFLIPLRDLYAAAVWCAGLFGRTVLWRDRRLHLDRQGRIC